MTELLEYLDARRAELRASFDAVPAAARDRPPAPGLWSAAAIVEHLAIVNERIAQRLSKGIDEARASGLGPETSTGSDPADAPSREGPRSIEAFHRTGRVEAEWS